MFGLTWRCPDSDQLLFELLSSRTNETHLKTLRKLILPNCTIVSNRTVYCKCTLFCCNCIVVYVIKVCIVKCTNTHRVGNTDKDSKVVYLKNDERSKNCNWAQDKIVVDFAELMSALLWLHWHDTVFSSTTQPQGQHSRWQRRTFSLRKPTDSFPTTKSVKPGPHFSLFIALNWTIKNTLENSVMRMAIFGCFMI